MKVRLDSKARVEGMKFGEKRKIGDATVSFHPAGHILGSAQIRVEVKGRVWVVSGDYKPQVDQTCEPFELVPCHGFISECTFGLPVYRWMPEELIHQQINAWWKENRANRTPSLLFAYSLGKAQRVLAGLDPEIGPIFVHGAVDAFVRIYRDLGVNLPVVEKADPKLDQDYSGAIILAPPAVEEAAACAVATRAARAAPRAGRAAATCARAPPPRRSSRRTQNAHSRTEARTGRRLAPVQELRANRSPSRPANFHGIH